MTEQLKPCPFCGGIAKAYERTCDKRDRYDPGYRAFPIVRCSYCGGRAEGKDWTEPGTAIEAWNRRAQPAQDGEPVAWLYKTPMPDGTVFVGASAERLTIGVGAPPGSTEEELYTHPPARVPLTKTRVGNYLRRHVHGEVGMYRNGFKDGVAFAEAAHGIGGGK